MERARRAHGRAREAAAAAQTLQRRVDQSANARVPNAQQALAQKLQALAEYAAVTVPSAASTTAPSGGADVNYGVSGIVDVPIDRARFEDNPIQDGFTRGGATLSDYRWAVETWETVVRPGVLAGKTRDDFERRDRDAGHHSGFRRTAGV